MSTPNPLSPEQLPSTCVDLLLADLPLKVVCAWCGVTLRDGVRPISHGMCVCCRALMNQELDEAPR
jgi:hypothetical protein